MSARATWKGLLKISLVTIAIKVYPATESSESLSFNQLHAICQTRIQQRKWCPNCTREVASAEIVKGFEFDPGRYVILSEDDFDKVKPESTRVIDLVQFAPAATLDPLYIDRSYYLAPDGRGGEAFAVMRQAMTGAVGIGKLAIYGREYLVAVRPRGLHLLLHTLHHEAEIRRLDLIEDVDAGAVVAPPSQVKLARQVIAAFKAPLDLGAYTDAYRAGLQTIIDAKIAGHEIVVPQIDHAPAIATLHEALTQSLQAMTAKAEKKRMAQATPKRKRA
jgi:DNA end-binding protein Ku